jgi:small subunit ribosomal protein S18
MTLLITSRLNLSVFLDAFLLSRRLCLPCREQLTFAQVLCHNECHTNKILIRQSHQSISTGEDRRKDFTMANGSSGPGGGRSGGARTGGARAAGPNKRFKRRKVSTLTINKITTVDYKNVTLLRQFTDDRGKIVPRRRSGATAKEQRMIATAIKRAREIALLPFVRD